MSSPLFKTYIWLVDTIYRAGKITLREINHKWLQSDLSDGKEMRLRTFHNWRAKVEETFDIIIQCDKSTNEYYIGNVEDLQGNNLQAWLLNSFTVSNLLQESTKVRNRIALENVPSGAKYLTLILESLRKNTNLLLTYQSYHQAYASTFTVSPYFLKLFQQRWYMIGLSDSIRIYALDRIQSAERTGEIFVFPKDLDVESYFADCYGIMNDNTSKAQTIRLKISAKQSNYVRDLPFHHSQKETERNDEFSIFEYRLIPTYDFMQEIMKYGSQIEVLSPVDFRNELSAMIEEALDAYQ